MTYTELMVINQTGD